MMSCQHGMPVMSCPHRCPHRCPHILCHAHHVMPTQMPTHMSTQMSTRFESCHAPCHAISHAMSCPHRCLVHVSSHKCYASCADVETQSESRYLTYARICTAPAPHGSRYLSYAPAPAPARMSISGSQVERLPVSLQVWNASLRVLHLQSSAPSCPCPGPCPGPWVQVPRHLLVACLPAPTRASW